MNRILIEPHELCADGTVTWTDLRAAHARDVLHVKPGDRLKIGVVNGQTGTGTVLGSTAEHVRVAIELGGTSPQPWADLLLAVPRPKVLKRLWPQLAALGVGRIVLLNAARVERNYFDSHWLEEAHYRPLLLEGLMQAGTTGLPEVSVRRRFRPFVEDELDALFPSTWRVVAHPGPATEAPRPGVAIAPLQGGPRSGQADRGDARAPVLLAVGPEGGWTEFELGLLEARGFRRFAMGERILRCDTACIALLAVLGQRAAGVAGT